MNKKKYFLIFVSFCLLTCSKQDDQTSYIDPIVGKWNLLKMVDVYPGGTSKVGQTYAGCAVNSRLIFTEEGTYDNKLYPNGNLEDENGNCKENFYSLNIQDGTWKKLEGNIYRFNLFFKDDDTYTVNIDATFPGKDKMIFTI